MPSLTLKKTSEKTSQTLSPAFLRFVSYLSEGERSRLIERRLTSPQHTRNQSVTDYIRTRSYKI